jgi:hypothetical protein
MAPARWRKRGASSGTEGARWTAFGILAVTKFPRKRLLAQHRTNRRSHLKKATAGAETAAQTHLREALLAICQEIRRTQPTPFRPAGGGGCPNRQHTALRGGGTP